MTGPNHTYTCVHFLLFAVMNLFFSSNAQSCVNILDEVSCVDPCRWDATLGCVCGTSAALDVVFAMDESGSVQAGPFQNQKDFVESLIETALTDADYVALITFGTGADTDCPFVDGKPRSTAVTNLQNIVYGNDGSTDIYSAVQHAVAQFQWLEDNQPTRVSSRVLFLITDGQHNEPGDPCDLADSLTNLGVTTVIIGVGQQYDPADITCLADQIIEVDSFSLSDLDSIRDQTDAFLCSGDTSGNQCENLDATCKIFGDPHYETFDGLYYHYQGGGAWFDVVRPCGSLGTSLPFLIAARQEDCVIGGVTTEYTCLEEVVVFFYLSDRSIWFSTDGNPTLDSSTSGTSAITTAPEELTYDTDKLITYEVGAYTMDITFEDQRGQTLTLKLVYKDTTLKIAVSSECFADNYINNLADPILCGLCGKFNNDASDDFTTCDDTQTYLTDGVSDLRAMEANTDPWVQTHLFGDSCCSDLMAIFLQDLTMCDNPSDRRRMFETDLDEVTPPSAACLDAATAICVEAFLTQCLACESNSELSLDVFVEGCEFDVCAAASQDLTGCDTYDCALANGYLATSLSLCEVDCDDDGIPPSPQPTPQPTEEPTEEPTNEPTSSCSTFPYLNPCETYRCTGMNSDGEDENPFCSTQRRRGCVECDSGYFKPNWHTPCVPCEEIEGCEIDGCVDWRGCISCSEGYIRRWDRDCGFFICV